ncbi:alpha/beta hydrolase [Cellulomonas sp. zg-ZUI222]|uniref:Alpha/beta hydrolase n=1 Tax=Cellulomonas wangleii TaxID=2816956 RepID=A0ABX8D397_9CELL|nr:MULTISPECIES: alpha/beta hydrolase [Cellulomonas]MBO0899148.1 alpha/beta hydrolase [Cellulomonas sp. zg-ZUI22]MBO0919998.1 alpha/beta hydrolase [Cellulomonas wangleii]MBO0923573.1 alpha/beta hydrolase [Cellulomonas wangleii]QVI61903.1 alpha/beta hydrolase [Cellulomonas wangleii]
MTTVDSASLLIEGPWQHRFVTANGARFHVALTGPQDAPLVVLLHGVPQLWWAWRHQLPVLAAAGYRVAAMDLRGTGGSDKPPQGYDVPTLAADVAGVVRSLGAESAVIVGAGTGGDVAWATGAYHPRVVRALGVLAAPHPLDAVALPVPPLRPPAAAVLAFAQLPSLPERAMVRGDLVDHMLGRWGGVPGLPGREAVETYRRAVRVPFAAHSQLEQVRWLVRSTPRPDGARYRAVLRAARPVPVLQVHGVLDGLRPASGSALRAVTAHVARPYRYELLHGAGHYLTDQAPGLVGELLVDWLAEVESVSP